VADLAHDRDVRQEQRQAHRHRLDRRVGAAFVQRRHHEQVVIRQHVPHVAPNPHQQRVDSRRSDLPLKRRALQTFTVNVDLKIARKFVQGVEKIGVILHRLEVADRNQPER
jgi:hypothetical protein